MPIRFTSADKEHLEGSFPRLRNSRYAVTSPDDPRYNCHAFAMGESHRWWEPTPIAGTAYWPAGAKRDRDLACFEDTYRMLGFEKCSDGSLETGYVKVALFVKGGTVTHTARQLSSGRWQSKLGQWLDLEHEIEGLEGDAYGNVVSFMKKEL